MKKGLIPIIAVLAIALLITGFTGTKVNSEKSSLEEKIKDLERQILQLKFELRSSGELKPAVIPDDPFVEAGSRVFLDGGRGWDEDGINMWTAVGPLPSYNVGIGTTTPWVKLEVAGHIRANRGPLTNIEVFADCTNNPAWDYAGIALSNGTYFPATRLQTFGPAHSPAHEFHIRHYPNAPIIFSTDNSERVRIAGNGYVGIGTNNPQYLLDINGNMRIMGGIHDGASLGATNQVLVADGFGGVAWAGSPGGSADYIWNQDTAAQTPADFWIDGTGRADFSLIGISSADSDFGVFGWSAAATGNGQGVMGQSDSDIGFGGVFVGGNAGTWYSITGEDAGVSGTGMAYGVMGWGYDATGGDEGIGVLGVGDVQSVTGITMYSGSGVCGYSETFNGVFGFTPADAAFGVYGYNSAVGGCGVFGVGDGIAGTYWGGAGVSGASDDVGVFGYGDATSRSYGVLGLTDATDGLGVVGWANAASYWVPPVARDAGLLGDGGYYGVYAVGTRTTAPQGIGVAGLGNNSSSITSPNDGAGVLGNGVSFGVWGMASAADNMGSVYGYAGGPFSVLTTMEIGTAGSANDGVGIFGEVTNTAAGWAGYFIGDVGCTGSYLKADGPEAGGNIFTRGIMASPLDDNGTIVYNMTSSEVKIYFDGEGQLVNGQAFITIPAAYGDEISGDVEVVVTPVGSWSGIYVASTTEKGFEVRSENGDPNAKFKWIAVAERKGFEKQTADSYVLTKMSNLPKTVPVDVNSAQMDRADASSNLKTAPAGEKKLVKKIESKGAKKGSSLK